MFSIGILFIVIAILGISVYFPGINLNPGTISGTLLTCFIVFLTTIGIVSKFRIQPAK